MVEVGPTAMATSSWAEPFGCMSRLLKQQQRGKEAAGGKERRGEGKELQPPDKEKKKTDRDAQEEDDTCKEECRVWG